MVLLQGILVVSPYYADGLTLLIVQEMIWVKVVLVKHQWSLDKLSFEKIRVIANLSKLHDQIHQIFYLFFTLFQLEEIFKRNFLLNFLIENLLSLG